MAEITPASNPLGTEPIGKLMVRFAVPSIIALVVNSLYNMVDQIFIGQGVGYLGNAATNVISPLMMLVLALGLMIGNGTAAFMGLNLGKRDVEKASNGVGNAITLTIGVGIVLTILCQIFLEPLCWLFGATENSISYCLAYGRPIVLGFVFLMIDMAFTSIIRADGRANVSMIGMLIGCVTNVILDPIFIFVFKWGCAGAAWATIIGQILNAIYFIFYMTRFKTVKLKKTYLAIKRKISGRIATLGTSSFITQFALVIVLAVLNNTLKACGQGSIYGSDIPVSAMGVVMKLNQVLLSIVLGLATGILPVVSYNYGSGQYDRVKKLFKNAFVIGIVVMTIACICVELFPRQIMSIFGTQSELYMEFGQTALRIYMSASFTIGISIVTGIFFQAIGKPLPSTVLSMLRQIIVLVPAILILGAFGNVVMVLWAGPISDVASCVASLIALALCWKKIFRKEELT